jgi:hypothetical protein
MIMPTGFADVVENVKQLQTDEKEELLFLLQRYLVEERRQTMYAHYQQSVEEVREHSIHFSSNLQELRAMVEE